jgi:uncharacterized cupin superfamily protein
VSQYEARASAKAGPEPVSLRHVTADTVALPQPQPKPTSRTGQMESTLSMWEAGPDTSTGVWECEPGEFSAVRDTCTEVCQILSGTATVHGEDGTSVRVAAGSLLVLPIGWRGTWVIHEKIRKTYVLVGGATEAEPVDELR